MGEVVTIASRKGGSGKTTTTQAIGAELQRRGKSVLLVDLDAQMNLTASMDAKPTGYNATQLFEEDIPPAQTIQHTHNGDIIAGSRLLAGADVVLQDDRELSRALDHLRSSYDYIIIDTPATYGKITRNALAASTSVLITSEAATFSLQGLAELVEIIEQVRKTTNPDLKLRGVVVTKYSGRSNKVKELLQTLAESTKKLGAEVIGEPIRATDKVVEAQQARQNLTEYAPRCTAALGYRGIVDNIVEWK